MAQEVIVPVKVLLENLLSIAKDMRALLGTLKVDSSGYKKLENVIIDIEKRIQSLQVMSARPFINDKLFSAANKEIIHIQDDLSKIRIEANKIKFSDLSLDGSLKAKLLEFDTELKTINDALKLVKDSAKDTFFSSEIGKAWKIDHPKDAGKSFAEITKIIESEVAKLEGALERAEKAQKDYKERIAAQRQLTSFISSGHELSKENLGEKLYNLIFDKNNNFKSGGRTLLQTWLQELFKLPSSVAEELVKGAGKKVQEAFALANGNIEKSLKQEKNRIGANLKEEKTNTNNGKTYASNVTLATTELNASRAVKQLLSETNLLLAKTEETLGKLYNETKEAREAYTSSCTQLVIGALLSNAATTAMVGKLQSLLQELDALQSKILKYDQAASKLLGISNFINRYIGAYAIIRKVSTAIRDAFNNIQELDKVITSIAVVTNMSQEDLWNKIGLYTDMALQYGVATKDVYTVSQIFYQQGLLTAQVMDLTTETLKMAKIAGMEYGAAANAMTVAVRAFKIEMSEALSVTDAYSALAAKFAVSSAEIANAMEKTASSAASVGMSLESTSAFISVMEQTTRESAQNIGSALKSIISRYGEMKASPDKLINVDGEEVTFNKVDTALSSIGISIKDAAGQFRDFDDVIMELAAKWNTLDNNTQRYIATVMAGNRLQSRFIALVSNYDELNRAMLVASSSENASIVQVAKTMDSLETKTNLLKNAFSLLYLDLHIENGLKNIYDWLTRIITTVGKLGTFNGAIASLANIVGFGTGAKSFIKNIQERVSVRRDAEAKKESELSDKIEKTKLELDTQQAEELLGEFNLKVSTPIHKEVILDTVNSNAASVTTESNVQNAEAALINNKDLIINSTNEILVTANTTQAEELINNLKTNIETTPIVLPVTLEANLLSDALYKSEFEKNLQDNLKSMPGIGSSLLLEPIDSESFSKMIISALDLFEDARALFSLAGTNAILDYITAILAHGGEVTTAMESIAANAAASIKIQDWFTNTFSNIDFSSTAINYEQIIQLAQASLEPLKAEFVTVGSDLGLSLITGMIGTQGGTGQAAVDLALNILECIRSTLDIHSPSPLIAGMIEEGVGGGIVQGLRGAIGTVTSAAKALGESVMQGIKDGTDSDKHPIISKLLDGKNIRLASSVLRMGGTALAGYGASIQDKSTDTLFGHGVEHSKIVTGFGNGLSGAGTGMSLGMMTGNPLVALAGGVVGFLAGGIGAIIDGLHMSLDERLELEKKEAKEKSDAALKELAKATDISSSIDNIKKLQKAMYNSTEDMQAYKDAMNTLGQSYPELISTYDSMGNAVINLQEAEETLISVRAQAATSALESAKAEMKVRSTQVEKWNEVSTKINTAFSGLSKKEIDLDNDYIYNYYQNMMWEILDGIKPENVESLPQRLQELYNGQRSNLTLDDFKALGNTNIKELLMIPDGYSALMYDEFIRSSPELLANETLYKNSEYMEKQLDQLLLSVASSLNLPDTITAREFFKWTGKRGDLLTQSLLDIAQDILNTKMTGAKNSVAIINLGVTRSFANEKLALSLDLSNLETEKKLKISDNGIFSSLIARGLESIEDLPDKMTASEWLTNEDTKAAADAALSELVQQFMGEILNIDLDKFLSGTSDLTQYLNEDDLFSAAGITDKGSSLAKELALLFAQDNLANRDRILNTIFPTREDGIRDINSQLNGLNSLSVYSEQGKKQNLALNIVNKFRDDNEHIPEIISSYANYFTDQLLEIDNLAKLGYTLLASNRLTALKGLSDALSNLDNSKELQNLFATITSIDFTNYDSLVNTQKAIEQYKVKNNITAEESAVLDTIIQELENALESLVFNVNTLVLSITESIANAAKETDNIISTNKSGIDLSNALSQLDTLNIGKSVEEAFKFDELFKFDATLGKYVYTSKGLDEALKVSLGNLEKTIALLKAMEGVIGKNIVHTINSGYEAQQLASLEFAGENAANDILSYIDGYATWTEKQQSYYETLANDFMADSTREHTWTQWLKFVQERHDKEQKDIDAVSLIIALQKKDLNNQLFTSIDWTAIARGTDYSDTNKTLVEKLALGLDVTNATWENVLEAQLSGMYGAEESIQKMLARLNIYDSIYQADISAYLDAIADILENGATSTLKASTVDAITRLNGSTVGLALSADLTIAAAKALLDTLAEKIGQGGYTLDSYNADAKSILEHTLFNLGGKQRQLLEFVSGDITADSLESLANALNLLLTDLVDVTTGHIKSELLQHLEYDTNTGTYKIATSFEDFINAILTLFNIVIDKLSKEYIKALSDYNDAFITKRTENKKTISDELSKLKSVKAGDWLNLSYTVKELKKYSKKYTDKYLKNLNKLPSDAVKAIIELSPYARLEENLVLAGAYIENGILKLTDDANLLAVAEALTTASTLAGLELTDELKDMVQSITKAYTDAIISGIKGGMTNTDATNLKTIAKNLGVNDISFTETAEGLKLSTESALLLYTALSQTNALLKKLVFKELKASLEENNEHYKDANALLTHTLQLEREIAEIRSDGNEDELAIIDSMTQELILAREILATRLIGKDTSWDFMSLDLLPDSIDNAISYWSSWADGIKDVASWAKTSNVDINKFSSMLKHVMDVALATGETFLFMGALIGGKDGKTWDEFISGFYKALDFDELGNAIFNLEKLKELGYDVSMGIEGISKELLDAVGTYAQENAKRLASFEKFYDGLADAYEKVRNSRLKFIDENGDFDASKFAEYLHQNEKSIISFYKFAETIKVNGTDLATLLRDSSTDWTKASLNYKALKGIYEMMMADDWDASQGYQAIIDHLSTSGFSGELTMGDMRFNVKSGKVIIETLDDKGNVTSVTGPDGTEYPNAEAAWLAIKDKELNDYIKEFAPEQEGAEGLTYTIAGLTYTIKVEGDHFVIVRNGKTIEGDFENIPEAFNKIAEDSTAVDLDLIKGIADREGAKKVLAGLQLMSDKGKLTYIQKGGEKRNDFSNATFGLNYNGIYSEAALANAQGKTAEQLQLLFTDIWNNTNLTTALKVAEVQVLMGIDVDPEKVKAACDEAGKVIEPLKVPIDWKAMAQQAELTSGATDVLSGITAAFSGDNGKELGKTFGLGIAEGILEALNKKSIEPVTESPTSPTNTGDNNGEGETVIISTYDDSTSNKNELLKDWTVAIEAYDDEGATKPEVEPVTLNIEIDENATGAALDENTLVASAGLIQDIRLSNNDTEAALKDNDSLANNDVNQDVEYTVNAVKTAILQNVADAKDNPAIQELRVTGGGSSGGHGFATGNVGPAKAGGTLIGELGPELVVSNGHYFVAGQSGAEFINLSSDAIVFNHLLTRSLLEKGVSNGRGRALTNERKAAAFAHGSGRALENGSILQAQKDVHGISPNWSNNMLSTIINNTNASKNGAAKLAEKAMKAFIKEVDRWYNYLQEIARLERDITKEEKLRSEYQSHMTAKGKEYADSLLDTLPLLRQQAAENRLLANDQEKWLKGYVAELADSPWAKFWTIDEHGQEKYNLAGFEKLELMVGTDKYGKPNMTPEELMAYLKSLGVTDEWFQYDSSGNAIDTSTPEGIVTAILSLWEHMDKTRETVLTHLDSIAEHNNAAIDNLTTINGHLKSIEDNLITVENKVLKAIEETRLREIDAILDEKDAIEKSSQALINGLSDLLSKEQDMYSRLLDTNELSRLQRLLSILQRSGGSASLIASLLKDITERLLDAYFDALKAQIAALLDASDNQLQKLQEQIDLMTELLAYEKEHGMLWEQVYQVMALSPEYIAEFIMNNTEEHWGKSPTEFALVNRETLFQAEWFKEISERVGGVNNLIAENDYSATDSELEKKVAETETANTAAKEAILATANAATNATNTTATNNTGTSNNQNGYKYTSKFAATYSTEKGEQKTAYAWGWSNKSAKEAEMMALTRAAALAKKEKGNLLLSNIKVYDRGGMVEQDGPAFVHAKESVLTTEQTSILRNEILGNKPNSALSMLSDLRELWNAAERTANIPHANDASVIIENATVEMNVSRIANDYDAQRAGEQALDQMLAIARRTQAQNRVGR